MSDQLQKAHEHRISGQYPEAESCYREVLAGAPNHAEACWGLANTLMNLGDFDSCREFFQKAVDLEADNPRFLYHMAMFLTMLGEYEEAKPLFEQVVELGTDPKLASEARKQLSYL
jgi:Flp pilus assembly protein TadD